jgi:DNA-binding MarR family transcriptional regulator
VENNAAGSTQVSSLAETRGNSMISANFRQSLAEPEKEAMARLMGALEPFRALRGTMPLQYVFAFLLVALEEGEGTSEYARRAGVSQSVMSRHLLDIGDRNRHMMEGFGLITQRQDPMNLSKHQCMLTPKGRALAHQIVRALGRK